MAEAQAGCPRLPTHLPIANPLNQWPAAIQSSLACLPVLPCRLPDPCSPQVLLDGYRALIWPNFQWLDPNTYNGYTHWGIYLPGEDSAGCFAMRRPECSCSHACLPSSLNTAQINAAEYIEEPNNLFGNEYCAGANATELLLDGVFGWSDDECSRKTPFICKMLAAKDYTYTSSAGGNFTLSTLPRDFKSAEAQCNAAGGHLASFTDQNEQYEVEQVSAATSELLRAVAGCCGGLWTLKCS